MNHPPPEPLWPSPLRRSVLAGDWKFQFQLLWKQGLHAPSSRTHACTRSQERPGSYGAGGDGSGWGGGRLWGTLSGHFFFTSKKRISMAAPSSYTSLSRSVLD
uniref:Uncharacterized protein n=1 Tax=Morchella brunnea TaxID=1174671 RepID=A0A8K1MGD5_9PEZI|nr:hypothetical protein LK370_mgp254 [Morchella brunnea]UBU98418.1 hypothetical protein [Morchella brunnea]